jgi:pyrimidine operon attenuation protein / uracil phosphoribosyltransferase
MTHPANEHVVLSGDQMRRTLVRIAHEILEKNHGVESLAIVGIHTRGAFLARRLHDLVSEFSGQAPAAGDVDISFYRDDVATRGMLGATPKGSHPVVNDTELPFELDGATVVLVDDVLFTGRTIRAAIDALFDFGRPRRIELAVLVDRGHRELPIRPDFVGKNMPTAIHERIDVRMTEADGIDEVVIVRRPRREDV